MGKDEKNEIYLGGGTNLTCKTSHLVSTHNTLRLITIDEGSIEFDIKIEADFGSIP